MDTIDRYFETVEQAEVYAEALTQAGLISYYEISPGWGADFPVILTVKYVKQPSTVERIDVTHIGSSGREFKVGCITRGK